MTRRLKVPFSLARKRIRASFNKYNVYNALTWRKNRPLGTQYREVFFAKQESRSYHGDRLTENQFKNHFRGDLPVVEPLQSAAKRDGSDGEPEIPYALQSFVGLERRLDFAVFRSMFASSVRQAAYFVLRGSVKVNGVRIRSPGYILKQGDVFSVDPRRVLYALGRPKPSVPEAVSRTNAIIRRFNNYIDRCHQHPERMFRQRMKNRKRHHVFNDRRTEKALKRSETVNKEVQRELNQAVNAVKPQSVLEQVLLGKFERKEVMGTVREIRRLVSAPVSAGEKASENEKASETASATVSATASEKVSATDEKSKPVEREKAEQASASHAETKSQPEATPAASSSAAAQAASFYSGEAPPHRSDVKRLVKILVDAERDFLNTEYSAKFVKPGEEKYDPKWVERLPAKLELVPDSIDAEKLDEIRVNLPFSPTGKLYGLAEPKKTWFTPWSPRQFVAPFAILPHHIEVDFETCHAVYMRDPVARPGHSEVVSPFSLDMHERAYLWYIQRRRKNLPKLHA